MSPARPLTRAQARNRGIAAAERFLGTAIYPEPDARVVAAGLVEAWQDGFNARRRNPTATLL